MYIYYEIQKKNMTIKITSIYRQSIQLELRHIRAALLAKKKKKKCFRNTKQRKRSRINDENGM